MSRPNALPETGFVRLASILAPRGPIPVSKSTWWAGVKSGRFSYADAEYFNLSEKDNRAAQSHTQRPFPSLEQAQHVIRAMPSSTAIEQRDRALVAFTLMTGCRDGALVSLKLKHIDLKNQLVKFDAREVDTKFSKSFETYFMPVGDDVRSIFVDWVSTLTTVHLWAPTDPLFPKTMMSFHAGAGFQVVGLAREQWTTANAVRRIFRDGFERAGLPYFHPHSFRHTLAKLGEQICRSPEEFKAWSQNLGHEHVMTTFSSYGKVSAARQAELIRQLASPCASAQHDLAELLRQAASAVEGKQPC